MAFSHCGGIKKEWEAQNLHGFKEIERYHKKDPYPLFLITTTNHGFLSHSD